MHTSTSGYLDTPAKYRDMAYQSAEQDEVEEMVAGEYRNRNFSLYFGWASHECANALGHTVKHRQRYDEFLSPRTRHDIRIISLASQSRI